MYSLIVPENIERPTRRTHKKSRAGCKTCKNRKLKCDEVKPVCGPCQRRFLVIESCDYGSGSPQPHGTRLVPLVPSTGQNRHEIQFSASSSGSVNASQSGSEEDWSLVLPASLRAELLDPFQTHPETKVKEIDVLMKHYLKTVVYTCFPWQPASETNPITTYYVPLVWDDIVLFHATLQLSAMRLQTFPSQISGLNSHQLSAECIRLLRDRVENEELQLRVSDQTISAVATLAAIEHERGNMKILRMHMDGLKRMVGIRGGLNAIRGTNPMVANSTFWMFVVAHYEVPFPSLDPLLPPFFPSDHNLRHSPPQLVTSHFQDIDPSHSNLPPLDLVSLGVTQPIATILASVQHVSRLVPAFNSYPTAATNLIILTRMCTLLSHLLSLPSIKPISEDNQHYTLISESSRFAILLHVFTPWRGLQPDGTLTINHLLHQLIHSLRSLSSDTTNDLLLWIFAVGGVASANMPERVWFIGHLEEMAREMGIEGWEEMKVCVNRGGIWHEKLYGKTMKELWDEIVMQRRILDGESGREGDVANGLKE